MSRLSYRGSLDFLFNLEKSGIKLGLDRTLNLLRDLGDPQRSFRSVHVAGTNGKGSAACFLNSILFHNGLATGLFTSPHLVDFRERIRKDGRVISRHDVAAIVADMVGPVERIGASYFEAATALAFEYFRRQGVKVAVAEVGMGGRLDSTNVLSPLASCITSIGHDHMKYLGSTLGKIAGEKAGIIKPGVPVVCGPLSKEAASTVLGIARARGSSVFRLQEDATVAPVETGLDGSTFEYRGLSGTRTLTLSSPGLYQVSNAGVAVLAAEVLNRQGLSITDEAISTGLSMASWPGRLQVLRRRPLVICDAAHNVSAMRALVRSLEAVGIAPDVTVFGVLRDKDYRRMIGLLAERSRQFVFTKPDSPRALSISSLRSVGREHGLRFTAHASAARALEEGLAACGAEGTMLVCGSLYLLGEVMSHLGYRPHLTRVC
jgi:dihydrofolate synthase/folylpolyglutamate synthase